MDSLLPVIIFVASILCFLIYRHRNNNELGGKRVPEAGGAWPIIGHLHILAGSQVTHRVLGSMADKYGPIFTIKFGVHRVLVVNNSEMAKECLTTNDKVFASRPKAMATELMGYKYANVGFAPYGPYWRQIRRIMVLELGSQHRLQMLAQMRGSEVKSSMIDMYKTWEKNKGSSETVLVDMKVWFENLVVNMIVKMMFGNHFLPSDEKGDRFLKTIWRFVLLMGAFPPSDAIPWLRWLDIGGYEKKMKKTAKDMDAVINEWLEAQKNQMNSTSVEQLDENRDQSVLMTDLLSRVKEEVKEEVYDFSIDDIVKASCSAIFSAGTDSTTVTLIWALALLVNNPLVLKKAQQELDSHVGRERRVENSDIINLVYLQAIIKETLRLYPAGPLAIPHESTEDCIVGGYTVPKGTRLLVNIWKIQHDPQIWTDPFEFRPERFLTTKKDIDVKGRHFELIPFGSGRRICLGWSFALDGLELILANIIHGFDFKNPSKGQIDMTEAPGIVYHKAGPLELLVAPRLLPHVYGVMA